MIRDHIRDYWQRFHGSFHDSETLFFARLQVVAGSIWCGLSSADMSPFITDHKQLAYWMIGSGIVNEYLRRRREDFH